RSVPIIYWALDSIVIIGCRFAAKWLLWPGSKKEKRNRPCVVIYGAGEAGSQLAASLRGTYFIAGLIDDDPSLHRREVGGIRVHPASSLPSLVQDFDVKQVILAIPSLSQARRKEIVASMTGEGLKVLSLPSITDLATGKYLVSQIREI